MSQRSMKSWRLVAVGLALLVLTSTADAGVRSGTYEDAQDTLPSLSGPREADIRSVNTQYDEAGTLTVSVTLWEPWNATTKAHPYFEARISSVVGLPPDLYCGRSPGAGDATVTGSLDPEAIFEAGGTVALAGFSGSLAASRSFSADGLTTTFAATASQLAGRDFRCLADTSVFQYDRDGHCAPSLSNCLRINYRYTSDNKGLFAGGYFSGYEPVRTQCNDGLDNDSDGQADDQDRDCGYSYSGATEFSPPAPPPPPVAACGDFQDNDGDGEYDLSDPGCAGRRDGASELDPAKVKSSSRITQLTASATCKITAEIEVTPKLQPKKVFPYKRATVRVVGVSKRTRSFSKRFRIRPNVSTRLEKRSLAPGLYRVSMAYPGDHWRFSSKARSREIRVC